MVRAVLDGVEEAGAETETVHLADLDIERCRMCDERGWGQCRREGACVIEDDFAGVVAGLEAADGFIFATPVYFGDLSESARAFTDRLRRISTGKPDRNFLGDLPTVGIAAAGGSGGGTTSCMASMEKVLGTPGCFVVDLIPVARRNRHYKAEVMKAAGRGLVDYIRSREGEEK
jgi:multimeric flavodoxin WrbA